MADNGKKTYRLVVNGQPFETRDKIEEGRSILQLAGFAPASDHILIELTRPGSRSVGLDEEVDFGNAGREEFRAFASDRILTFTLDERGYEWGEPTISEAELRAISGTPANKMLLLERQDEPDLEIEPGSTVNLDAGGTERIRSEARRYRIIVNAREEIVTSNEVTYAQLVALAFQPVPSGPNILFTITYSKGPKDNPKGTLPEGMSVTIKNGMIFVVTQTNRS